MSSENENLNFEVVSEIDENTKVITTNDYEGMYNRLLEEAVKNYETGNDRFSSVFEGDSRYGCEKITLQMINQLAVNPRNSIISTRKIANIVDMFIHKNYLLGMVDAAIWANLNTKYTVTYPYIDANIGRNKNKKYERARTIVDDLLLKIDVEHLIRNSIPTTFEHGNYFCYLDTDNGNYTMHVFPLSVVCVAPYKQNGEPILMIDMDALRMRLEHSLPKKKGGKAYFFKNHREEIEKAYPKEIVDAFRNKDTYAVLDYRKTGIIRAGEDGDGSYLYGISQMFRALSDIIVLDDFSQVDDAASKVKAKNILVQTLRSQVLGADGRYTSYKETAYAHSELIRAVKNKICVYTGLASVEDVKWIEPKSDLINVENVSLYENRVLSTLGIGFLSVNNGGTAVTAQISLTQLLRQINRISEQVEHYLEKICTVVLAENGISEEYSPRISIVDSEQLDAGLKLDLAKFLYGTLGCSRKTVFDIVDINLNDEVVRRSKENNESLDDVFRPYSISYTKSGTNDGTGDGNDSVGRPADKSPDDPDKQNDDKERNNI